MRRHSRYSGRMRCSADSISRRAALQRAALGSIGTAAAFLAAPAQLRASLHGRGAAQAADRLLMVFCRDAALTGADELAFFHGSTTRLEPSLGAWLVHAKGPAREQRRGLQCVEWGPTTSAQRMAYAGGLPDRCRGEAKSIFEYGITRGHGSGRVARLETELQRGARVVQTLLPADAAFSLANYSREQREQCLLVFAGTRERIEAGAKESRFSSEISAPIQLGQSALHIVLLGLAVLSQSGPRGQPSSTAPSSVRPEDLHATVLAGMGLNARRLVHAHQGRTIRPLAAQGRVIPGVYA